ncbi:hypothetical protein FRC10_001414 [Ceratobasidium sp. 414]|nr:hypothetical protein FRC10_001414 [Ceratobasidium sp. 414]
MTIILDNIKFKNVTTSVVGDNRTNLSKSGEETVKHWTQGNIYGGREYSQGTVKEARRSPKLLDSRDGMHDDTSAIQKVLDKYAGCKIIYFGTGTYYVTDTIKIAEGVVEVHAMKIIDTFATLNLTDIYIYALATVGAVNVLNLNSIKTIISQTGNRNSFQPNVAAWTSEGCSL